MTQDMFMLRVNEGFVPWTDRTSPTSDSTLTLETLDNGGQSFKSLTKSWWEVKELSKSCTISYCSCNLLLILSQAAMTLIDVKGGTYIKGRLPFKYYQRKGSMWLKKKIYSHF